jgi:precorrin-3B C17-methyltransferase
VHQLSYARDIFLKYQKPETPVAIIKGAYRESQSILITTLEKMLEYPDMLGMITTVIVGNSSTFNFKGMMINPRGYRSKYRLIRETSSVM